MKDNNQKRFKIFVLLLLIGVLFFVNNENQGKFIKAYKSLTIREKSLEKLATMEMDSTSEIALFEKNIAIWKDNKLSLLDKDEEIVLEKQFNFETPGVVFDENRIYIMDKFSGDIYILDSKGDTIERVTLENKIQNLTEIDNNIIIHTESESEEKLVILDTNGVFLKIQPIEDMIILTYAIDLKNEKYLMSHLNIEDELYSEIQFYSISGDMVDKVHIYNEIVVFTEFLNDDLITLTDKSLYYIKDGSIFWKKTFPDIKDILLLNNEIYVLYENTLEVIDLEGRTTNKLTLTNDHNKMKNLDNYIFIYGNNDIIGLQGDREILEYRHDTAIKDIVVNKNYLGVIDDDNLHLFRLINK